MCLRQTHASGAMLITADGFKCLRDHCPMLTHLTMRDVVASHEAVDVIASMPMLRHLDMRHYYIGSLHSMYALRDSGITNLAVCDNNFKDPLFTAPCLSTIAVDRWKGSLSSVLEYLEYNGSPWLSRIHFHRCEIGISGLHILMPNLVALELSDVVLRTAFGEESVLSTLCCSIAALKSLSVLSLQRIRMQGTPTPTDFMRLIECLPSTLTSLTLDTSFGYCSVGLKQLVNRFGEQLVCLALLRSLTLTGAWVCATGLAAPPQRPGALLTGTVPHRSAALPADADVIHIATHCPRLTKLAIPPCTGITATGLEAVAANCSMLEHIDISGCTNISPSAIVNLACRCAVLRHISMYGLHDAYEDVHALLRSRVGARLRITYRSLMPLSLPDDELASMDDRCVWADSAHAAAVSACLLHRAAKGAAPPQLGPGVRCVTGRCLSAVQRPRCGVRGVQLRADPVRGRLRRVRVRLLLGGKRSRECPACIVQSARCWGAERRSAGAVVQDHASICRYRAVPCINRGNGCMVILARREMMAAHIRDCLVAMACGLPNCREVCLSRGAMLQHWREVHEILCETRSIRSSNQSCPCFNQGCDYEGRDLAAHMAICPYYLVICGTCRATMTRGQLMLHVNEHVHCV